MTVTRRNPLAKPTGRAVDVVAISAVIVATIIIVVVVVYVVVGAAVCLQNEVVISVPCSPRQPLVQSQRALMIISK